MKITLIFALAFMAIATDSSVISPKNLKINDFMGMKNYGKRRQHNSESYSSRSKNPKQTYNSALQPTKYELEDNIYVIDHTKLSTGDSSVSRKHNPNKLNVTKFFHEFKTSDRLDLYNININ
ncbi:uncharacterized protein LOC127288343 [Leptopilina boulardi]|uniref:uncharacterized protein LOC127288343 n=1 Tax=Leptopilina boulardi TaxID=63433 RepID=UPI0021F5D92F|nr:uncharacterized protein LOC127288343 [Leptopilina boulardi]